MDDSVSRVKDRKARGKRHDYTAARMLFATGKTHSEICEATGIPEGSIAAECARKGWMADREKVQAVASQRVAEIQASLATMPERGRNWASRVAEQADRGLAVIEKEPIESLKDVSRVTSVLDQVDKVARRSYGLDDEAAGQRTIVNLGFLQDYRPDDPVTVPATVVEPALTDENPAN